MGVLVSWINTAWSIADARPTGHEPLDEDVQPTLLRQDHHDTRPTPAALAEQPTSVATSIPSIETPAPPSPRGETGVSPALFAPSVGAVNSRQQHLCVSSDYDENDHRVSMAGGSSSSNSRSANSFVAPGSPPPTCSPALRIDVAAANDPTLDHEMTDASFINTAGVPDASTELYFDDEGLSTLEKFYLFARSAASFHRVFISRSLPSFLSDVSPCEAVEYVIPLMNGLAMDEDEAVKEALVEDLVSSIWWFLTRCQIVEQEIPEGAGPQEVPLLNVQSFTPLLGTLLLNPSADVNAPARHCVVNLLARIREADSNDTGYFGPAERKLFEHELIQHVVIGMAHLDNDPPAEEIDGSSPFQQESLAEQSDTSSTEFMNPPPSAADDEVFLSTLTSSVHALATTQFLAQEEAFTPTVATIAAIIQRPPSPIPTVQSTVPIPEYEPEFAHIISRPATDESLESEHIVDQGSPMNLVTSLPTSAAEPMQNSQSENAGGEQDMHDAFQPQIQAPRPEHSSGGDTPNMTGESAQIGGDIGDVCSDFNEEQAAIGKLASMSLIAAVTASGSLDRGFQSAFVEEVKRAGHDPVYWVRREATFALGALAKVVPEELLHVSLLPLFDFFCEDSIWNVRQSVLFALPAILSRLPSDSRRSLALRTIQKLSIDPSPQVRTGVLEVLGEVIYSFHEGGKGPPDEVIRLFVGEEGRDWHAPDSPALQMFADAEARRPWAHSASRSRFSTGINNVSGPSQQPVSSVSTPVNQLPESDPARSLICAFNLPAVTLTLGLSRWHELRGLYLSLVRTGAPKVRQTLAASIGEIAKIIGPENARRDLLYCWWDFARGRDSSVRTKALEALEVFLQELNTRERERIVGSLEEIWDDHMKSWREREIFARSLDRLAPLLPSNGEVLRSLLRRALRDPVAAVRNAVIEAYPRIYGYTLSRPEALKLITKEVVALAYDGSFKNRLTYVECARSLITADSNYDRFMDESFWQFVVVLASDKIADVRIGLARLLGIVCDKILTKQRTLPGGVLNIVRILSEDKVADVRAFVLHILPPDGQPPTERAYGHISEGTPSMATFSRPPPQREPKTLAAGINDITISDMQNQYDRRYCCKPGPVVTGHHRLVRWTPLLDPSSVLTPSGVDWFHTYSPLSSTPSSRSLLPHRMLSPFLLYRAATFALFIVCNAIICTVAAWNIAFAKSDNHLITLAQIDSFLIFAGASGLVVVFTVIFVEVFRRGAVSSRVWFEIAWLTLFWIFNFAGATAVTAVAPGKMCSFKSDPGHRSGSACTSSKVLIAFAWLNTCFVFLYFFFLTVFSIMHQKEDTSVWRATVCDFPWFGTKQCIRSVPSSPIISRFVKSKPPSLVVPKPRRAPPPPVFIHGRAGLSSQVEIEHFTDVGSPEAKSPPAPVAPPPPAAVSFYPQHMQLTMQVLSNVPTTYHSNTYYSSNRGTSPPPIRDWPRPIASNPAPILAPSQPLSDRAAQKQRAPSSPTASDSSSSSQRSGRMRLPPPPPPLPLERTTTTESAASSQNSPLRSRPTGPRTRSGSSGFVRPRPPPLDLTREGSTPSNSRRS